MHGAPRRTILGLRTYDGMSLYFVGKKSNLTGLCEILNNFNLEISENSQKVMSIINKTEHAVQSYAAGNEVLSLLSSAK